MTRSPLGVVPYGFDGPVDYIARITNDIWNLPQRNPELIRKYYSPATAIHTDAGDLTGDEIVIANTLARLRSYPDFHGIIDDTIWTGSEDEGYRTSMRWTWTGTDSGGTGFGPATHRYVKFMAIANCIVQGEVIVEEWLGANPLSQARQLGYSAEDAVRATSYPRFQPWHAPAFPTRQPRKANLSSTLLSRHCRTARNPSCSQPTAAAASPQTSKGPARSPSSGGLKVCGLLSGRSASMSMTSIRFPQATDSPSGSLPSGGCPG